MLIGKSYISQSTAQIVIDLDGSPGLVVKGGDSWSEGHGFKSQHRILDGHFSHMFVVKIVMFVWKDENKWKKQIIVKSIEKLALKNLGSGKACKRKRAKRTTQAIAW